MEGAWRFFVDVKAPREANSFGNSPMSSISHPFRFCKGWFCWVFNREPQDGGRSYLLSTEFSSPFPEGRQIWETGTAPAQMAASSWLWQRGNSHSGLLAAGPLPSPQQARAGPLERRERESLAMPAAPGHPDPAILAPMPRPVAGEQGE